MVASVTLLAKVYVTQRTLTTVTPTHWESQMEGGVRHMTLQEETAQCGVSK